MTQSLSEVFLAASKDGIMEKQEISEFEKHKMIAEYVVTCCDRDSLHC